ncbi:hypothetical protein ACJMK2_012044 [Sinanodonta woodiana]|uniref:Protein FAM33A n=2 Tax=Sinanodonta woodiana TaxID=1069815 RepID=A0ABD3V9V0_SINWO
MDKMEKTVENLEAMFQKAESDINYLNRKLDFEFEQSVDADERNPVRMLQRINDIKKEYSSVVKEAQDIQKAQKEAVEYFQTQLATTVSLLQKLQKNSNFPEENPEELRQLEEVLGLKLPISAASSATECSDLVETDKQTAEQTTQKLLEASQCAFEPEQSPAGRRRGTEEFKEVTDCEFETISEFKRGHVKLSDVNMAYRILWRHFVEEKNSGTLDAIEMHKMGLRVAGKTGQAKLQVLKALDLIKISPKGLVSIST